jgi:hypothetical protein
MSDTTLTLYDHIEITHEHLCITMQVKELLLILYRHNCKLRDNYTRIVGPDIDLDIDIKKI